MNETDIHDDPLFQLWQAKRQGDRLPARRDFAVTELAPWMGDIGLIDVVRDNGVRFRFRLVGSNFTWLQGTDVTGRYADEVFDASRAYVIDEYDEVLRTGEPMVRQRTVTTQKLGANLLHRKLILPLASDGTTIDMLLIHVVPLSDRPRRSF